MHLSILHEEQMGSKKYFHGADSEKLNFILKHGLKAPVYITENPKTAVLYSARWNYKGEDNGPASAELNPSRILERLADNDGNEIDILPACLVELEVKDNTNLAYDEDLFADLFAAVQHGDLSNMQELADSTPKITQFLKLNKDKQFFEVKPELRNLLKSIKYGTLKGTNKQKISEGNYVIHNDIPLGSSIIAIYEMKYYTTPEELYGVTILPSGDYFNYGEVIKVYGNGTYNVNDKIQAAWDFTGKW